MSDVVEKGEGMLDPQRESDNDADYEMPEGTCAACDQTFNENDEEGGEGREGDESLT